MLCSPSERRDVVATKPCSLKQQHQQLEDVSSSLEEAGQQIQNTVDKPSFCQEDQPILGDPFLLRVQYLCIW